MMKIAGLIITKNLKVGEMWALKVISGRLVWILMTPAKHHFEESPEDNYDSATDHIIARDFMASLCR